MSQSMQLGTAVANALASAVVYRKGEIERGDGHYSNSRYAFYELWSKQLMKGHTLRIVRPGIGKLKWLTSHLAVPDGVSDLVHAFLSKGRIPSRAINLDLNRLRYDHEYRTETT